MGMLAPGHDVGWPPFEVLVARSVVGTRGILPVLLILAFPGTGEGQVEASGSSPVEPDWSIQEVLSGLSNPTGLAEGPGGTLLVAERMGRVLLVEPSRRVREVAHLSIDEDFEVGRGRFVSGLMSVLHDSASSSGGRLYATYSYPRPEIRGIGTRLVLLEWDGHSYGPEQVLFEDLPGKSTLNGGRLALVRPGVFFVSVGDAQEAQLAQLPERRHGKIFRVSQVVDSRSDTTWTRELWSMGHRNPQGLAYWGRGHVLFATEHGSTVADEVNIVEFGGNYGWPLAEGRCGTEACMTAFEEPLTAFSPPLGISGVDVVDDGDDGPTLLVSSLKAGRLMRLVLSEDGRSLMSSRTIIDGDLGRLRDVLSAADGSILVITSNTDHLGEPRRADDRLLRLIRRRKSCC